MASASIKKPFISNGKQYTEAELFVFENYHILHTRYHPKVMGHILKNKRKVKRVS